MLNMNTGDLHNDVVKLTVVLYPSLLVIIAKKGLLLTKVEMSKGFTFNEVAVNICEIK